MPSRKKKGPSVCCVGTSKQTNHKKTAKKQSKQWAAVKRDLTFISRDGVIGSFVIDGTTNDYEWASQLQSAKVELWKMVNESEGDVNPEKWESTAKTLSKAWRAIQQKELVGKEMPHVSKWHPIAGLIHAQNNDVDPIFIVDMGKFGKLVCLRDKKRKCKKHADQEMVEKPPFVLLEGFWTDANLPEADGVNASSTGPNLWLITPEVGEYSHIQNICELSHKDRVCFMTMMRTKMPYITTEIQNYMTSLCNLPTSRQTFAENGITCSELDLWLKHMQAMDLCLTFQASTMDGFANTSVPVPHWQTNLGYPDAYLSDINLSREDLVERNRLRDVNSKIINIFSNNNQQYVGQYRKLCKLF